MMKNKKTSLVQWRKEKKEWGVEDWKEREEDESGRSRDKHHRFLSPWIIFLTLTLTSSFSSSFSFLSSYSSFFSFIFLVRFYLLFCPISFVLIPRSLLSPYRNRIDFLFSLFCLSFEKHRRLASSKIEGEEHERQAARQKEKNMRGKQNMKEENKKEDEKRDELFLRSPSFFHFPSQFFFATISLSFFYSWDEQER